jgi:DNA processing protein
MPKVNSHKLNEPLLNDSLANLNLPLKQLYYGGQKPTTWLGMPKVGIVGSRRMSSYGSSVTDLFAAELARQGAVIISGLAYGVDARAHRVALEAGGLSVAVLPTSIDNIYPAGHRGLAEAIAENGSLLSEYGPEDPIYKNNFTDRNRIIAALCDGLLIPEAAVNSGSLHTARFALELGKTVMAVPGNITSPLSEGCNNLIKSGAIAVTSPQDVIFALGFTPTSVAKKQVRGGKKEQVVFAAIAEGVSSQDELSATVKIGAAELNTILTSLEINGYIKAIGAGQWHIG